MSSPHVKRASHTRQEIFWPPGFGKSGGGRQGEEEEKRPSKKVFSGFFFPCFYLVSAEWGREGKKTGALSSPLLSSSLLFSSVRRRISFCVMDELFCSLSPKDRYEKKTLFYAAILLLVVVTASLSCTTLASKKSANIRSHWRNPSGHKTELFSLPHKEKEKKVLRKKSVRLSSLLSIFQNFWEVPREKFVSLSPEVWKEERTLWYQVRLLISNEESENGREERGNRGTKEEKEEWRLSQRQEEPFITWKCEEWGGGSFNDQLV